MGARIDPVVRCAITLLAACGGSSTSSPRGAAPSATPTAPSTPTRSPAVTSNVELVARCATEAVELLGWNPVPDGAHHGEVIKTSLAHGGSRECEPLVDKANKFEFVLGDDVIDWDWEPKDQVDATTIRFIFTCAGCRPVETQVELPRRWHCFSWLEAEHSGTLCEPDRAACETSRKELRANSTPCELRTGAAWCQRGTQTCSDSPWSCANSPTGAPCDRVP